MQILIHHYYRCYNYLWKLCDQCPKFLIHRVLISSETVLFTIMFPKRIKRNSWVSIDPNGPTLIFSGTQDFQNRVFALSCLTSNFWKDVRNVSEYNFMFIAFFRRNTNTPVIAMKPIIVQSRTRKGRVFVFTNLMKQNESVITHKAPWNTEMATTALKIWLANWFITWWPRYKHLIRSASAALQMGIQLQVK